MKWPPRKWHRKGKRAVGQLQSHRANLHREFREQNAPPRAMEDRDEIDRELKACGEEIWAQVEAVVGPVMVVRSPDKP